MSGNGFYYQGKDKSKEILYDEDGKIKMIIITYSGELEKIPFPCKKPKKELEE